MPKPRLSQNRPLPERWRLIHGAYYYRVPLGLEPLWDGKQSFRLGSNLGDAYATWSKRLGKSDKAHTVGQLLDRYALEVVPKKALTTQEGNYIAIRALRKTFGAAPITSITPRMVYQYVDKRTYKIAAHREIEVLSHAFTKAVEWGYIDRHPFKGEVRLEGEEPRDRYVDDWEVDAALSIKSRRKRGSVLMCQAYTLVKLCTGLARSDLLRLEPARHFTEEGIKVTRHKTAKKTGKTSVYGWGDVENGDGTVTPGALRIAVDMALAARPVDLSPFLFCTRDGVGYINEATGKCPSFKSIWGRFIDRVIAETKVEQRFTEHDLRAKVGSDAENLTRAQALLQHADPRTTARVYRRKPEFVAPAAAGAVFVFKRSA